MESESTADPARHYDRGGWLVQFTGHVLVVCPRCGGCALVLPRPGLPELKHSYELLFRPRRLACRGCGAVADWKPEMRDAGLVATNPGGTEDPFFRRPLWLQTRCADQILWAYNEEHVAELSAYVGATLREHGASPTRAMIPRLPRWMKRSANRSDVLAGLETLRGLARRSAPADRSDAAHERGDRPQHYGALYFRGGPYESSR
ncbi:hypothetical protein AB0D04_32875 [Streptomyces sp. NPDC048483]|uniref:hypothetical protein n=1 Tax=Streptomyces sp. NPDC048483 TaxID=3154927 RepID=UPI003445BEA1